MPRTNLKINAVDGYAKNVTTTVNYINPSASKQDMLNFTKALNNLTTNTYKTTDKIVTTELDTDNKQTATITPSISKITSSSGDFTINYNGDGTVYHTINAAFSNQSSNIALTKSATMTSNQYHYAINNLSGISGEIKFYAPETDQYTSAIAEITIGS